MGQNRIVEDPNILVGKPTVKGTRISVELVLEHLAETLDPNDLYAAYPRLTPDDVRACLSYARRLVRRRHRELRAKVEAGADGGS